MGLKGKLDRLQKTMQGKLSSFELADGRRHYFDPTEAFKDSFLFFTACMTADCKGEPRPEPPEVLRAVAAARDRGAALFSVMGDSSHLPLDRTALLERGELVNRSLVAGRELGEPLEDLSEP
jgi:hypothetical protein